MREDPRVMRTREALRQTLRTLLVDHTLDEISVAMLCREAGVHRTTFYGHTQNVRQFAISQFSGDLERIATVPVDADRETPEHVAARYVSSMHDMLAHIAADRPTYRALFASESRGAFRTALESRLRPRAARALEVFAVQGIEGAPLMDVERAEAAAFIAGALVGAIEVWTMADDVDAAAASARIARLMPRWWPDAG